MNKVQVLKFHGVQEEYFNAGPQPTLFLGGVGSGKTWIGILKLLSLLDEYPGSRGVIIRQRFSQLKKTTAATLRSLLPRQFIARRNDNEGIIQLTNGSELLLMHLDKADSIDNLKSLELNFAYVDQMEDISQDAWDVLLERLGRWSGALKRGGYPADWPFRTETGAPIPPVYAFASAYSPGYSHWITSRWWKDGDEREHYRKQGYVVYVGSTVDNPNLTKSYVQGRMAMGEEYVERFVHATSWGANEGKIFEIDPQSLLEPTAEILAKIKGMRLHRVLDPGDYSPTACLWYATDSDNNVFFYREYEKENELVSSHRLNIFELSQGDGWGGALPRYHSDYADPAINQKSRGRTANQGPQWSVRDEWSDRRIMDPKTAIYWALANNDEAMTLSRVREYMRVDETHRNPFTGKLGAPRVYFIKKGPKWKNGCYQTIRDIRAAQRKEVGQNADGTKQFGDERDPSIRDHCLDCVRYALGMRPSVAKHIAGLDPVPGHIRISDYYKEQEEQEERKQSEQLMRDFKQMPYGR